jgi:hypothetical protein
MPATDPVPTRIPHAGPTATSVSASPATTTAPASPAPAGSGFTGAPVPVRAGAAPARVRSALPVRWAFAGVLAVFCAVAGAAAGLAGCGLRSPLIADPPAVQRVRTVAAAVGTGTERAAVDRWLAAANRLWLHRDAAAFDRLTTGSMRRVYRDVATASGGRVPLRLTDLFVAVPCQTYRASVFVAYARTDAFAPGQRSKAAALVFTRHDRTWRLAAAVTSRSGQWPALCQALNPCVGPAVLPPPAFPRFLAHELSRGPRIRYSPGAAPVLALPLAGDRGYWVLATVTGHGPRGARAAAIYAATDPAQAAGGHLTLDASLGGRK